MSRARDLRKEAALTSERKSVAALDKNLSVPARPERPESAFSQHAGVSVEGAKREDDETVGKNGYSPRAYVRDRSASNLSEIAPKFEALPELAPVQVLAHPIVRRALGALRNKETPPDQYRTNCQRLMLFLLVEATRSVSSRPDVRQKDELPPNDSGEADVPYVFLALNRYALGLAHQMADCVPDSIAGLVGIETGEHGSLEARLHLVRAPALSDSRVVLFAPVIETGRQSMLALNLLRNSGGTDLALVSLVSSSFGLKRLRKAHPEVRIWTAAIDEEYDLKAGGLVPGIGNFAQRFYGSQP